jgi:hypothetical protein
MRHFRSAKYSMTAMSVPISLLALAAFGCSGSDPPADESSAQAVGGAPHETGSLADPGTGDAGSPVTPSVDPGTGAAGSPVTSPVDLGTGAAGSPVTSPVDL